MSIQMFKAKHFANGSVYALWTHDHYPVETTDTFLPFYTKDAVGRHQNQLCSPNLGDRGHRWMIGVSTMSGCPVRCRFCATGQLKRWRNLTAEEILAQVEFVLSTVQNRPEDAQEFKVNYTRMGEPFLNIQEVRRAIALIDQRFPGVRVHHYISTIGVEGADYSWIRDNVTLQISLHSLDDARRDWLIPYRHKVTIQALGAIRTSSALKTTINLTLVDQADFDIQRLRRHFAPEAFFIKISPINPNKTSDRNQLGHGVVEGTNLA